MAEPASDVADRTTEEHGAAGTRREMALYDSYMNSNGTNATATIRVPVLARDQLAEVAKFRGRSLASYVSDLAKREWRIAVVESEHEAALKDLSNPEAMAEYEIWEETLEDGLEWI